MVVESPTTASEQNFISIADRFMEPSRSKGKGDLKGCVFPQPLVQMIGLPSDKRNKVKYLGRRVGRVTTYSSACLNPRMTLMTSRLVTPRYIYCFARAFVSSSLLKCEMTTYLSLSPSVY